MTGKTVKRFIEWLSEKCLQVDRFRMCCESDVLVCGQPVSNGSN